jgi:uncharacterized YigZ family protein
MGYYTVLKESKAEFEEKKSLFIGHVKRVYSEEEARSFINKIKSEHKQATHNVYAYIIGENKGIQRYSDDGEPQGTAGIPVLEVIKKNDITDVVVVVTRYFGGILLGAGGLVRAYSKGAAAGIKEAGIVEKVLGCPIEILIDYDLLGKVQYICSQKLWHIDQIEYTDKVKICMSNEVHTLEQIKGEITDATAGKAVIDSGRPEYYFRLENKLFKE